MLIFIPAYVGLPKNASAQFAKDVELIATSNREQPLLNHPSAEIKTKNALKWLAEFPVYAYQKLISDQFQPSCLFTPSCSQYGRLALQNKSIFTAVVLVTDRLSRCNHINAAYYTDRQLINGRVYDPLPN